MYAPANSVSLPNAVPSGPNSFNIVPKAPPAELTTPLNALAPCCPLAIAVVNPETPAPICLKARLLAWPRELVCPAALPRAVFRLSNSSLKAANSSGVGAAILGPCNFIVYQIDHNYI